MFFKKFSKTDYEILRILVSQGEFSSVKISKQIGVSDKTVRNRIKVMKDLGIFKKVAIVNPEAFGYNLKIDYFLDIDKKDVAHVTDWLLNNMKHNISYLGRHWGNDNISMQVLFKTSKDAEKFNKELDNHPHVSSFEMTVVPVVFKDTHDWRPHQDNFNISQKGLEELETRRIKEKEEPKTNQYNQD